MNILATVFGGSTPLLPHVTWPVVPYDDESLAGFVARTCANNGLRNPSVLIADAGIRLTKGFGRLARTSRDLSALGTLLAVDPSWVENRRHPMPDARRGARGQWVEFHGAILRRAHLFYSSPRVAPSAILEGRYHREIWHVYTLAACGKTGELVVDSCEHPGCGKFLSWVGTEGVGSCSDPYCKGTIANASCKTIAEADRSGFALAAAIIDPCDVTHSTALAMLPTCLREENRGHLFELAWLLGCLDQPGGLDAIILPSKVSGSARNKVLARGADRLLAWPNCLTSILQDCVEGNNPDTSVARVVGVVQAIVRKPTTFGRAAALLSSVLKGISTNAFSAVVGRQLGLLTATEFSRAAGLKTSKMAVIQRSPYLPRVLFSEGGRDLALFSPDDATDVRRRIRDRLTAQVFGSAIGLGIDAVELLIAEETLSLADDPIIQALWPEPHLDRAIASRLRDEITQEIRPVPAPIGSIRLSAALHGCSAGDKPWPAIVQALLAGQLSLYSDTGKQLNIRSCLISPQDVRKLRALRLLRACPDNRSAWLREADAKERLSITGQRLRLLTAAGELCSSGCFSGLTYRRTEVNAIAAKWISTLELQAKLGLDRRRDLSKILAASGLVPNQHGLVPRPAARERLGFLD